MMRSHWWPALGLVTCLGFIAGCQETPMEEVSDARHAVQEEQRETIEEQQETAEAWQELRQQEQEARQELGYRGTESETSPDEQQRYIAHIEERLQEIDRRLERMQTHANDAAGAARESLDQRISELRQQRETLQQKLDELKAADETSQAQIRDEIEQILDNLQTQTGAV